MDRDTGMKLLKLKKRISADFSSENWEELGLLIGASDIITRHPRLLRSLNWGDEDYDGNVIAVLREIAEEDPTRIPAIEAYLDTEYPEESEFISAKPSDRKITFSPYVFRIPEVTIDPDLVAVMMPFSAEFSSVYHAIKSAATSCGMRCLRADDIWEESTIIQDIFNLIFQAQIVVVDFTGKNPNVMYETGIAHTLGKHVIPITQSINDIPSDTGHHRALKYLSNSEGLMNLQAGLTEKFSQVSSR